MQVNIKFDTETERLENLKKLVGALKKLIDYREGKTTSPTGKDSVPEHSQAKQQVKVKLNEPGKPKQSPQLNDSVQKPQQKQQESVNERRQQRPKLQLNQPSLEKTAQSQLNQPKATKESIQNIQKNAQHQVKKNTQPKPPAQNTASGQQSKQSSQEKKPEEKKEKKKEGKTSGGCRVVPYEDMSDTMSNIFSKSKY